MLAIGDIKKTTIFQSAQWMGAKAMGPATKRLGQEIRGYVLLSIKEEGFANESKVCTRLRLPAGVCIWWRLLVARGFQSQPQG